MTAHEISYIGYALFRQNKGDAFVKLSNQSTNKLSFRSATDPNTVALHFGKFNATSLQTNGLMVVEKVDDNFNNNVDNFDLISSHYTTNIDVNSSLKNIDVIESNAIRSTDASFTSLFVNDGVIEDLSCVNRIDASSVYSNFMNSTDMVITNDLTIENDFLLLGNQTIHGTIDISDTITGRSSLVLEKDAYFKDFVNIDGSFNVNNDVSLNKNVDISDNLSVGLNVTGTTLLVKTHTTIGATDVIDATKSLTVSGDTHVIGNVIIDQDISMGGSLDLSGSITSGGSLDLSGSITSGGSLDLSGNITSGGSLDLSGTITSDGSLDLSGNITSSGSLELSGNIVANDISANSVDISGNMNLKGNLTIVGDGDHTIDISNASIKGLYSSNEYILTPDKLYYLKDVSANIQEQFNSITLDLDLRANENNTFSGINTFQANTEFNGNLVNFKNDVTISGDLTIRGGDVNIMTGDLLVAGDATIAGELHIQNAVSSFTGDIKLDGKVNEVGEKISDPIGGDGNDTRAFQYYRETIDSTLKLKNDLICKGETISYYKFRPSKTSDPIQIDWNDALDRHEGIYSGEDFNFWTTLSNEGIGYFNTDEAIRKFGYLNVEQFTKGGTIECMSIEPTTSIILKPEINILFKNPDDSINPYTGARLEKVINLVNDENNDIDLDNVTTKDLTVSGDIIASSNLSVIGNITTNSKLNVQDNILTNGSITSRGISADGSLNVTGNITGGGSLSIANNITGGGLLSAASANIATIIEAQSLKVNTIK